MLYQMKSMKLSPPIKELKIIESVPGWSHDIKNIGVEDVIYALVK